MLPDNWGYYILPLHKQARYYRAAMAPDVGFRKIIAPNLRLALNPVNLG